MTGGWVGREPVGRQPVGLGWVGRVGSSRLGWLALAVVLGVGLAIGSGLAGAGGGKPTPAQRIAHLESVIGCPSCADLSVAESNAGTAVAIRQFVVAQVHAGASDAAVEAAVEAGYGASIVLSPPTSGPGSLVWILPVVAVILASGGLVFVFRRRRGVPTAALSDDDRMLVEEALRR
ncbi:MAG: cytochrome c-type biogenesis protein [Acidimicrobiales bacterium]